MASHKFGACEAIQDRISGEWRLWRNGTSLVLYPSSETQAALLAKLIGDLTDEQWAMVKAAVNASLQAAERNAA